MKFLRFPSLNQRWILVFGLWTFLLSGALSNFVGSPGAIQGLRLKTMLEQKQSELSQIRKEVKKLQHESTQLEKSSIAQEKEIHRVLGYAGNDEIIFDFVPADHEANKIN